MGGGVGKPFKSFEPAESYYVSYRTLLLFFAQINPSQVNQLRYNWYGTQFLCISATMQPKLYDRDGEEMWAAQFEPNNSFQLTSRCSATYIKGDPYIRDMKNTAYAPAHILFHVLPNPDSIANSGHVGEVTGCYWDPSHENRFITSSADSTIR